MDDRGWKEFFIRYGAKIVGALLGLAAGILFLTVGFWKTLLLLALMLVGWLIGGRMDGRWGYRMKRALRRIIGDGDEE